jgi:Flp pilus assembly protein TadG
MALTISVKRRKIRISGRLGRICSRFVKNSEGATAVEFALVSVPFLGLLFAIFETAFVFFATQGVEAAVNDAARYVMTGQVQYDSTITSAADFKDKIICNQTGRPRILPSFIDCNKLKLNVQVANSFTTANTAKDFINNPTETYCTGTSGQIVVVRLLYPMPVYLSILSMTSMSASGVGTNTSGQTSYNGKMVHMLMGTSVFRNEPFPTGTPAVTSGC